MKGVQTPPLYLNIHIFTFDLSIPWNSRSLLATERVPFHFTATRGDAVRSRNVKTIHSERERLCGAYTAASSLNRSICTFTVKSTSRTCAWKRDKALAVCNGTSTFMRNCLCSAFRGNAKPLMILQTENRESTNLPLWLQLLRYQSQTGTGEHLTMWENYAH